MPDVQRQSLTTSDNSKYRDSLVLCISVRVLAIRSNPWPQPASHLAPTARFLKLFHFMEKSLQTCRKLVGAVRNGENLSTSDACASASPCRALT